MGDAGLGWAGDAETVSGLGMIWHLSGVGVLSGGNAEEVGELWRGNYTRGPNLVSSPLFLWKVCCMLPIFFPGSSPPSPPVR